jgi:CHAT domain-containing protein
VINETQPELSGLLLAEDDDPHENGILQTYEIFNLTLGADLVVLSGCETGLGRQVTGEGLVGVMQAFLYAGTPSVLVSLWPVAESSTPRLMLGVYKRLGAGDPKAVALQESKLDMLQTQVWAHPFYWSPFVLVGDGR